MKKTLISISLVISLSLLACSNEKSGINTESGSGNASNTDSSTTNPVNSEYGTPNASENPVDSAQSAQRDSTQK